MIPKIILSADNLSIDKDNFWLEIVLCLKKKGFEVPYWIGLNKPNEVLSNTFFHETIDAFKLEKIKEIKIKLFDIENLTIEEYYNYLKILDRIDKIGGYSFSLRDRLLKDQLNYWYSILLEIKPNLVIFSEIPHALHDYPLHLVAKKLNIKTLIFNFTSFKGWYFVTDGLTEKGNENNMFEIKEGDISNFIAEFKKEAVLPYEGQKYQTPWYMIEQMNFDKNKSALFKKRIKRYLINSYKRIKGDYWKYNWQYSFLHYTGNNSILHEIYYKFILRKFKKNLFSSYKKRVLPPEKLSHIKNFLYIPLHYQPEATTAPLGGMYSDQIYMIEKLREIIPHEVALLVKEHYSQFSNALPFGFTCRNLSYWDNISNIPNTYLVSIEHDSKELILNSLAVATVTGTAGWEAIMYGKYCIAFGSSWYKSHPSVIKFGDVDFEKKISNIIEGIKPTDKTGKFLEKFCRCLIKNEIHGSYITGEQFRSSNEIVNIIEKFYKEKILNDGLILN